MNISRGVISCTVNILYVHVLQLIIWDVKTDWKFLPYLSEPLYTCRGLLEKSEEKKTRLKNIPVTILGAILAISNNRFRVGLLSFMWTG
jgi:hypothetical protein